MEKSCLPVFIGLICVLGMFSCSQDSIVVNGKVMNADGKKIVFSKTIDGIYTQSMDTLFLQPDSTFTITFLNSTAERLDFYLWGARELGSVYLKPGVTELNIDASAEVPIETEQAQDAKVMKLLSEVNRDVWSLRARRADKWNIAKDTVASSVLEKLTVLVSKYDNELTGIDVSFKHKAQQDIRMQLLLAFENQYLEHANTVSELSKQEWIEALDKIVEFVDLNNPDNVFSPAFPDVIRNLIGIQIYDIDKSENLPKDADENNLAFFDRYEKKLNGRVREVAMANIFLNDYQSKSNAPGIPELYDRFLALYQQSILKPLLDKAVAQNKAFNEIQLSDDIHIINSDNAKSFKEITDRFLGKVIYIDIWATWCGPCRESFSHVKPLQQYAKENDIVLLYVSIDRPSEKDKWMKMANYYELKGEHVLINESFKQEIYDIFGNKGALYIPHCAIINKKGELQLSKASGPEDLDKLISQLKEAAL